jgi:glycerol-3-phosphate acyltransferase PlsX
MRIALDAMGGDAAPAVNVEGAIKAIERFPSAEVTLVGDEVALRAELKRLGANSSRISIRHASQVVGMDESPVEGLRRKPDSSIRRSVELMAEGKADAVVSAGNTGAFVAATAFNLRPLKGVKRPGIAVTFPIPAGKGKCTVIDVGANIKCKPIHLLQYSIMASIYNKLIHNIEEPIVGLLNIGEEDAKGTDLVKETHALLSRAPLKFKGNVEGRDILLGECDVVVCEGFVGNVILKLSEGIWEALLRSFYNEAKRSWRAKLGLLLCKPLIENLKKRNDFTEYGGAPLLGVDGICIVCHGSSDAKAIHNAIGAAIKFSQYQVNEHITKSISADGPQE